MSADDQLTTLVRQDSRRILATLVRLLGDLDLAEESMQEAFRIAAERWPQEGTPARPRAWIVSTARFKGIDVLRRRTRGEAIVRELAIAEAGSVHEAGEFDVVEDDQLRLIFTCCHPALTIEARVALALKEVCGLGTDEVARSFLVESGSMKRRLSRAKAKIRDERIPYAVPDASELPGRCSG